MLQLTGGSVFRAQPMEKVSLLAKRGLILIFQENPPCVRKNFDPTEGMHLLANENTGWETLTKSLCPQHTDIPGTQGSGVKSPIRTRPSKNTKGPQETRTMP